MIQLYNRLAKALLEFEGLWLRAWRKGLEFALQGLNAPLVIRNPDSGTPAAGACAWAMFVDRRWPAARLHSFATLAVVCQQLTHVHGRCQSKISACKKRLGAYLRWWWWMAPEIALSRLLAYKVLTVAPSQGCCSCAQPSCWLRARPHPCSDPPACIGWH